MFNSMTVHVANNALAIAYAMIVPGLAFMLGGAAFGFVVKFLKITVWK